ncbi:MAG: hypothetical protein ACW963_07010, partial [Candidatus Sifarchaeia archaeon]
TDLNLKSGHHPLFIPTISLFHWLSNGKHPPSGVKSKPGPLGQDSLLDHNSDSLKFSSSKLLYLDSRILQSKFYRIQPSKYSFSCGLQFL